MRSQKVRCLRPFLHRGRMVGTGERLVLESNLADELRVAGYVAPLINGEAVVQPTDRWVQPEVR